MDAGNWTVETVTLADGQSERFRAVRSRMDGGTDYLVRTASGVAAGEAHSRSDLERGADLCVSREAAQALIAGYEASAALPARDVQAAISAESASVAHPLRRS